MIYKVLHVVRPVQGGIKKHLLVLLQGFNNKKYHCFLAAPPDHDLVSSLGPFARKIFSVPIAEGWYPARDWQVVRILCDIINKEKFDLVHTHGIRAGILGQMAALLAGHRAVVATIHNSQNPRIPFFTFFRLLQALLYRVSVSHVIAVSEALKGEIQKYEWMPAERITVIYNGIDYRVFKGYEAPRTLPPSFGLSRDLPVIGTAARLEPRKGIKYLIEAIPFVDKWYGPAYFIIVGDGPERESLEGLVKKMNLSERVIFTGYRSDIPPLLSHFDLVVIPSIQEGLSIFCLEALASGRAVIATSVGGLPEIIRNGRTGVLVPPADPVALAQAIGELLKNRELAVYLGR
ncbi:MAG: glycosyltransferase family 4 protein [Bacillota bacterium]|nr:glycosyltransferase family 4 protein [Bacillota bacterium]